MRLILNLTFNKVHSLPKVLLLSTLLSCHAHAADDTGQYLIMGLGNLSCKSFLSENDTDAAYYLSWLAGYMTAYNHLHEDTYSILGSTKSIEQVESWLRDYCTVNGDESFEQSVRNLLKNLKYFRDKQKP